VRLAVARTDDRSQARPDPATFRHRAALVAEKMPLRRTGASCTPEGLAVVTRPFSGLLGVETHTRSRSCVGAEGFGNPASQYQNRISEPGNQHCHAVPAENCGSNRLGMDCGCAPEPVACSTVLAHGICFGCERCSIRREEFPVELHPETSYYRFNGCREHQSAQIDVRECISPAPQFLG